MEAELSTQYFRELLDKHIKELQSFCKEWEDVSDKTIAEEVVDEVRTTIGLTNLLIRQKLKQFGDLIDDSEFKRGEKEITCIDLHGFWDMVFREVEKIQKSFEKLEKCRSNNWVFIQESVPKIEAKKKPTSAPTVKDTTAAKAHAVAARLRFAEVKKRMMEAKKKMNEAKSDCNEEIAIIETNSEHTYIVAEKIADLKEPVSETVKDLPPTEDKKETSNKTSKKLNPARSNKKTVLPQEMNGRPKKQKSENISNKGKENSAEIKNKKELLTVTSEKAATTHTKKSKLPRDVAPLQCVTRSARRAMLAQQND